ncbi:tRNA pseudouridine(38-40) synthase TruA [Alteromonas pelagimontana]|uniref:tRNA pseudouridine synthase A n=1 Tax=Alteromonas pelagimontana TaxID=1858656 RepID=A0A6M4MI09_9ALTE|nr:tRNA pseudouridine(38-40) synthase TruA [Alteromonas pelagimontana]QJR82230.1 tRNA pseudouridine(38-40) synthase TruA [Alteromonas pelagimontana]
MPRIALGIEYDGAAHYGWQRQNNVPTVQEYLEKALSKVADKRIDIFCAGRTDAGVHATAQVVHFDTDVVRPERAWTMGINANVPDSIAVTWCKVVDEDFHARFSATHRRYRYIIYNDRLRPAILHNGVTHEYRELDESRMHRAAQAVIGEHDFSAFRAAHCQSRSPYREVTRVEVSRLGKYVILDIHANAFLHHMVRNITGSLMDIGAGEQGEDWIAELIAAKDRTLAAATAKPNGLYLVHVTYPERFELPVRPIGPLFLPET